MESGRNLRSGQKLNVDIYLHILCSTHLKVRVLLTYET
jgi:hypothetical protein